MTITAIKPGLCPAWCTSTTCGTDQTHTSTPVPITATDGTTLKVRASYNERADVTTVWVGEHELRPEAGHALITAIMGGLDQAMVVTG